VSLYHSGGLRRTLPTIRSKMTTARSKIERSKRMRVVAPRPEEKGKVIVTFRPTTGDRPAKRADERHGQRRAGESDRDGTS